MLIIISKFATSRWGLWKWPRFGAKLRDTLKVWTIIFWTSIDGSPIILLSSFYCAYNHFYFFLILQNSFGFLFEWSNVLLSYLIWYFYLVCLEAIFFCNVLIRIRFWFIIHWMPNEHLAQITWAFWLCWFLFSIRINFLFLLFCFPACFFCAFHDLVFVFRILCWLQSGESVWGVCGLRSAAPVLLLELNAEIFQL